MKWASRRQFAFFLATLGALAAILGFAFALFRASDCVTAVDEITVRGNSMGQSLPEGKVISVLKGYYLCHSPERGDMAVFSNPNAAQQLIVKRIVGIEGDEVYAQSRGRAVLIYLNDQVLRTQSQRPYQLTLSAGKMLRESLLPTRGRIPPGYVLVMGEKVRGSFDSAAFGPISINLLRGKVRFN